MPVHTKNRLRESLSVLLGDVEDLKYNPSQLLSQPLLHEQDFHILRGGSSLRVMPVPCILQKGRNTSVILKKKKRKTQEETGECLSPDMST